MVGEGIGVEEGRRLGVGLAVGVLVGGGVSVLVPVGSRIGVAVGVSVGGAVDSGVDVGSSSGCTRGRPIMRAAIPVAHATIATINLPRLTVSESGLRHFIPGSPPMNVYGAPVGLGARPERDKHAACGIVQVYSIPVVVPQRRSPIVAPV